MEESRSIQLSLGDTSLSEKLGVYYIDMRPARIHYEGSPNTWGGGFDQNGVPTILTSGKQVYYPINIAQYGFILHAEWLEDQGEQTLDSLKSCLAKLEELKTEESDYCVWWHQEAHTRYNLKPPWASAMAQGEIISFYLRMYQILKTSSLLDTAEKAAVFMNADRPDGVRRSLGNDLVWLEEYPSSPPSYVLNGFIYAIFGLYDLYRVTNNSIMKAEIDLLIRSLKARLPEFSTSYWSLYDLQKKELVRYYYQRNVHIPQMDVLFQLTGDEIFKFYRDKWKAQLNPLNFLFVQVMYRLKPRLSWLDKILRNTKRTEG